MNNPNLEYTYWQPEVEGMSREQILTDLLTLSNAIRLLRLASEGGGVDFDIEDVLTEVTRIGDEIHHKYVDAED